MKRIRLAAFVLALCLSLCACKSSDYEKAMEQFNAGAYQQAKGAFAALADYEDSAEMVKKCDYLLAMEQFNAGAYQQAKDTFTALSDYEDSPEMVKKCDYQLAVALLEEEKYEAALAAFEALGDYADSADRRITCLCAVSLAYAGDGKLTEAVSLLVEDYQDPRVEEVFCTILFDEMTNNYLTSVNQAIDEWNEYLLIWIKAVQAEAARTPVGQGINIPKVDQSAPQVISLQRCMEKANKSIAGLREAYSQEVMEVCAEDVRELLNTIYESTEIIDKQFQDLDSWAVTTLFYGIQDNNAAKANTKLINAIYSIEDAVEVLMDNRG